MRGEQSGVCVGEVASKHREDQLPSAKIKVRSEPAMHLKNLSAVSTFSSANRTIFTLWNPTPLLFSPPLFIGLTVSLQVPSINLNTLSYSKYLHELFLFFLKHVLSLNVQLFPR